MVNFDKLTYLQTQHFRRLFRSAAPSDLPEKRSRLLAPMDEIIRELEENRTAGTASTLDELVPAMQPPEPDARERHIDRVLRILEPPRGDLLGDGVLGDDVLRSFVLKNWYFFWTVCDENLAASRAQPSSGLNDISVRVNSNPRQLVDAVDHFLAAFTNVPEESWVAGTLHDVIEQTAGEDVSYEKAVEPADPSKGTRSETTVEKRTGHRILRWALANFGSGPGLAGVMEVLGKKETIRRLEAALRASALCLDAKK